MSNTYILPPVVFAFVPGMGTVVSRRTAPPSRSVENASVASTAAAKMLTAVLNNVRYLSIASLPVFSSLFSRLQGILLLFGSGFNQRFTSTEKIWNCDRSEERRVGKECRSR